MLIRIVRDYLRPHRGALTLLVLLQLVGTIASLYLPSLNGRIIDEGVARGDTDYIMSAGGWMLAVSLAQIAATVVATYLGARAAAGLGRDLRADVFATVGEFSAQEVSRFGAPTLMCQRPGTRAPAHPMSLFTGARVLVRRPPPRCSAGGGAARSAHTPRVTRAGDLRAPATSLAAHRDDVVSRAQLRRLGIDRNRVRQA